MGAEREGICINTSKGRPHAQITHVDSGLYVLVPVIKVCVIRHNHSKNDRKSKIQLIDRVRMWVHNLSLIKINPHVIYEFSLLIVAHAPCVAIVARYLNPPRGTFVLQGAQKTKCCQLFSSAFPVTFNGFASLFKFLSVWAEVSKHYLCSSSFQPNHPDAQM